MLVTGRFPTAIQRRDYRHRPGQAPFQIRAVIVVLYGNVSAHRVNLTSKLNIALSSADSVLDYRQTTSLSVCWRYKDPLSLATT